MRLMPMNALLNKTGKAEAKGLALKVAHVLPQNTGDTELYFKEIHNRADTITPLLKQILEFRPSRHWDMNK